MDENMKKTKTAGKPKSNKKAPAAGKTAAGKKSQQCNNTTGRKKPQANKKPVSQNKPRTSKKLYQPFKLLILFPVRIKKHRDKNGGHHNVILEDFEDKHVSVGLTTKPKKGKNATNYKCEIDPLGGKDESYMRRQGIVVPKTEYEPMERKGHMSEKDLAQAKIYGERAKQKYLEKGQQKSNDVPNT